MLFAVGTRVKFLYSRDEGVITELLDNGMVNVLLEEMDMIIPAFTEDLIPAEELPKAPPLSMASNAVERKKEKKPVADQPKEMTYSTPRFQGIQLAFDPVQKADHLIEKYRIFLINDTAEEVLFTFTLWIQDQVSKKCDGKLASASVFEVGDLLFDHLNDSPAIDLQCWRITTQGTGPKLSKTLKIKPKQFFNRVREDSLLDRPVHLFSIFEDIRTPPQAETANKEDLRTYTQRNARPPRPVFFANEHEIHDVVERASFLPEIDLHIEKLVGNPARLNAADILRIQLDHFERYIEKAIRLGAERVFIIHGVGKGRLRDTIASRLLRMPEVKTFKNEYHPRYGYGATEVIF